MANTKITNPKLFNLGDSTSATQLPVMTFTERNAMNPLQTLSVYYLVVAGGGGGGGDLSGGGGAGGLLTNINGTALNLSRSTTYTITVGEGGRGGIANSTRNTENTRGGDGSDSILSGTGITTITSTGGGGGGVYGDSSSSLKTGRSGGSGGGAGAPVSGVGNTGGTGNLPSTTPAQGNNGGSSYGNPYSGGGGGGAGAAGGNAPNGSQGGSGGIGVTNTITGVSPTPYYAGGGGGSTYNGGSTSGAIGGVGGNGGGGTGGIGAAAPASIGSNGTNGLGGGGGGGSWQGAPTAGGSGGSGVVILRYPSADVAGYTTTGLTPTETIDGTDTILSFTDVGTGTITFALSIPIDTTSTGETIFNSDTDKVEYWDGTKWYGITYEPPTPVPVGGTWDPANSITSACAAGSSTLSFSNNNRLATESGTGYYVAAFSTVKVGDFWFFGTDAGGLATQFEGNFDAADQIYVPTSAGTYMEIKWLSADLQLGITKTRTCPFTATWNSNTIRWFSWTGAITRYNDTPITSPTLAINDILGILIDVDGNTVKFYRNNVLYATLAL